ncbi:chemotaxis-specific protein-glutamate methyltransferase CheB [Corallococcus sp. bb12-1]|uniref:Protein-glutamate methylesterase/protein-glutamine glutaminase n=1 Tax=Corallococcus terminator TaxID=2316733 RepID=A0A3A8JEL9_9BACT|nr:MULTISPECIES: chemotaxis-specific protein-glutamate methyltransferase CheB [Corallococcus]MCY1045986.1 chemotaxis-specific protein-glutamate methyltransferase CheB [Corallococcus sp. bb12-1]RKG88951.1 chemotaxis-specific protein-glutamate methyltransferase CheB [Corallococcus terminator]
MGKKVSVLVVDDSLICRQLISAALSDDPDVEVVGTAANGVEAVALTKELRPHVITMDVDMPVMDGLTAVEHIMAECPTPILVLTGDPRSQAPALTYRALELGALALQIKPSIDAGADAWNLTKEVKLISSVRVIRHLRGPKRTQAGTPHPTAVLPAVSMGIVAVAASTGGPQVLYRMLSELPVDFPAPIVIVQHINAAFSESLASWLANTSKLKVRLAQDGDVLAPGLVLVAPPDQHTLVPVRGRVALKTGVERDGHMPSGTMLLESVAKTYGRRAVGVVLTGMGADGADGLLAIKQAGGLALAQNEESCVVFGMPGAAVERKAVDHLIHGDDVAATLAKLARGESLAAGR